jgi:type 1 glutamine amidotransferase
VTSTTERVTTTTTGSTTAAVDSSTTQPETTTTVDPAPRDVLVFHRTTGFRHESIGAGIRALEELGVAGGYEVTATDDPAVFTADQLASFGVIVFLNTTGDVLDEDQQAAMEQSIGSGRGFVGVHSAADTEYDWGWYGALVGAYFDTHPQPQDAMVAFAAHPVTEGLPDQVERFDEWYDFQDRPPDGATILATVDESSYEGGAMGNPHPIAWAQEVHGARSVYIGFGHTGESFDEPLIRTLLDNAIRWVEGD